MYVVYYHNVIEGPTSEVDRQSSRLGGNRFAMHMRFLREHFHVVSVSEYLQRLDAGELDPRCVCLTFDDAYAGVGEVAAPILAQLGIPATVFAISDSLDRPDRLMNYEELEAALHLTACEEVAVPELGFGTLCLGSDKVNALFLKQVKTALKRVPESERSHIQGALLERLDVAPEKLSVAGLPHARKMTAEQLQALLSQGLWEVGAHTQSHRVLAQLPPERCHEEIFGCRAELIQALGSEVSLLAYPYGKAEHVGDLAPRLAREAGFRAAFSTVCGNNDRASHRHMLRRVEFLELMAQQSLEFQNVARKFFGV